MKLHFVFDAYIPYHQYTISQPIPSIKLKNLSHFVLTFYL